jgi:hypothetical protein
MVTFSFSPSSQRHQKKAIQPIRLRQTRETCKPLIRATPLLDRPCGVLVRKESAPLVLERLIVDGGEELLVAQVRLCQVLLCYSI